MASKIRVETTYLISEIKSSIQKINADNNGKIFVKSFVNSILNECLLINNHN